MERARDRFGSHKNLHVPTHLIYKMFRMVPDGTVKKLLYRNVEYILVRKPHSVNVVTIYCSEPPPRLTKDCRRKYRRWCGDWEHKDRRVRQGASIKEWDDELWN